jgi:SIR2-like domain
MDEALAQAIKMDRAVLFVGAGVSMRLGLPSWQQLIARMATELGFDPAILLGSGASYLTVAEYYKLEKGAIGGLRSWMDREWNVSEGELQKSIVHNQIVDLGFKYIYTTNYDRNLERIFDLRGAGYSKIVNAKDIALADPKLPHIVKFHGDFDDDASMVLTESDYFERLNFETPLDVKFRADILGRMMLFVGYSLNDLNMRLLLYKMQKMWKTSGYEADRPPSYMFMARPDPVQERVLRNWGIRTMTLDTDKIGEALPDFFEQLKSKVLS